MPTNIAQLSQTKPAVHPEMMLPEVQNMIFKFAWQTSQTYPVTYDEALAECNYAFVRACYDYKAERGQKFSSWCYYWIWTHLKTWITSRTKDPLIPTELNEEMVGEAAPERAHSLELIEDLSNDAKEIVMLLLETPKEILGVAGVTRFATTPKMLMDRVRRHLIKTGWTKEAFEAAEKELRSRFQTAWSGAEVV